MFLKLTNSTTKEKVRININKIILYFAIIDREENKDGYFINGSCIHMIDKTQLLVKEKPEEIDYLLQQSYITVKEPYENRTSEILQHSTNSPIDDSKQSE